MTPVPALSVSDLSKAFGGLRAVEGVALSVAAGERRALIGPNGAGKTTLFNLISGDLSPSGGRIALFGRDVTNLPPNRRAALGLARTYQITNLFPSLTVLENLLLAVQALERTKLTLLRPITAYPHLYTRAHAILDSVGLADKVGEVVRNLSHGEQRQMEVALALACRPRLLLLDEPTAGLSPAESRMMTGLLKRLDNGITLLVIEHDMDVAFELTDRVTVLHNGKVVADGSGDEVKADPLVREIYLGSA
ncbi:MAG TPA: ABC transporter ATP-binding protein [Candidatus Methylomirabilis sp.]|nr:ABC transporter ATP-binding protein [Candidatus Methylomirabilis sp.]